MHHGPSYPFSESAWKILVLSRLLLLGRLVVSASESICAHFLEARLDLFWSEHWPALWAMVRAECDVAPVFSNSRKTAAEQKQSRARKVATLGRSGERGRAPAVARNAPPVPVTQQTLQEINSLYPADQDPAVAAENPRFELLLLPCCRAHPITIKRMPRLCEPGPLAVHAEHWYDFGEQAGDSTLWGKHITKHNIGLLTKWVPF